MGAISVVHRPVTRILVAAVVAPAVLLPLCGCGRSNLHQVSGRVKFADGSPLTVGRVVIEYDDSKQAWGRILGDGSFTIGTFAENDGMKPGTWKVAIRNAEFIKYGDPPSPPVPLIHERYGSTATSGLSFEVPKEVEWTIVVDRPAKPEKPRDR